MVSRGFCQDACKECWLHGDAKSLAMKARRRSRNPVQEYRCVDCEYWHIGGRHIGKKNSPYSRRKGRR